MFVHKSKTRKELFFWYAICITFLAIGIYNVHHLCVNYYSKPTHSQVVFRTSTRHIKMPNMTFILRLPLLEFTQRAPIPFHYSKAAHMSKKYWSSYLSTNDHLQALYSYLCPADYDPDYLGQMSEQTARDIQKEFSEKSLTDLLSQQIERVNSKEKLLFGWTTKLQWIKRMNIARSELVAYWDNLLSMSVSDHLDLNIDYDSTILTNRLLFQRPNNIIYKLIALQSIAEGVTLNQILMLDHHKGAMSVKNALTSSNKNVADLLDSAIADLGSFLNIRISGGKLVLSGWELDGMDTLGKDDQSLTPHQTLRFYVIPEDDGHLVQIDVHSFIDMWQRQIIDGVTELAERHGLLSEQCKGREMFEYLRDLEQHLMILYMNISPRLQIDDQIIILTSKLSSNVTLTPKIQFSSKVDNCCQPKNVACFEDCASEKYIDKCSCIPWTLALLFTSKQVQICDHHCSLHEVIKQECNSFCEQQLKHPCNFSMSHALASNVGFDSFKSDDRHVLSINIFMPETSSFVHAIEDYELSSSSFLSQIGGALEFWSGINVLCAVHLLFFAIFHPQTWKFVQKLMKSTTKHKEKDQVQPMTAVSEREFQDTIDRIRHRMYKKLPNVKNKHVSKFSWLKENRWFKQTPMAGYNYIVAASTVTETVFWHLLIVVLAVITALNLHSTLQQYSARPTRITIFPTVANQSLNFPNLTLELRFPLFELHGFDHRPIYDAQAELSTHDLYELFESQGITTTDIISYLMTQWLLADVRWPEIHISNGHVLHFLSDPQVFLEWQAVLDQYETSLKEFAGRHGTLSWQEMQQQLPQLLWSPLSDQPWLNAILMHSLSKNHIQVHLMPDDDDFIYDINMTSASLLEQHGIGARDLMVDIINSFSRLLYIEAEPMVVSAVPNNLDFKLLNNYAHYMLHTSVSVPTNLTKITLRVYSFVHMWFGLLDEWLSALRQDDYSVNFWLLSQINSRDLIDTALEQYDMSYGRLRVNGIAQSTKLLPYQASSFELWPSWQMQSHTDNCETISFDACIETCIHMTLVHKCNCIPWEYFYVNTDSEVDICSWPCALNEEQNSNCTDACSKQCQKNLFEQVVDLSKYGVASPPALFEVHGHIRQTLHPVLTEKYQLSIGELLSNVGGLLDFWLGANLLAFIHLFIFIIKQWASWCRRKKPGNRKRALNHAHQLLAEATKLSEVIKESVNVAAASRTEEKKDKPWFGWVWGNRFFDETSLTGFEFIASAKYKVEAVFWWLLITVFCVLTVFNIHNAVMHYYSRPTHINVQVESQSDHVQIGNLTLKLDLLLADFAMHNPTSLRYAFDETSSTGKTIAQHLACALNHGAENYFFIQLLAEDMFVDWMSLLGQPWMANEQLQTPRPFFSKETMYQWQIKMDLAQSELLDFLIAKGQKAMPSKHSAKVALKERLLELFDAPMKRWQNSAAIHFMALESLKTGKEPKQKLQHMIMDEENHAFLYELFLPEIPPYQAFNSSSVSALKLYNLVLNDLSSMLHIETFPESLVYLQDWGYDISEQEEGFRMVKDQSFKLLLVTPGDTKTLQVKIHSFMHLWQYKIMEALFVYFDSIGSETICGQNIDQIIESQIQALQDWVAADWEGTQLRIVGQDNQVLIHPFMYHEQIDLTPTMRFMSQTSKCFNGSKETCVDECLLKEHKSACGCMPWALVYIESSRTLPLCSKPCSAATERTGNCWLECETKLLHPCHLTQYSLNNREFRSYGPKEYKPLYGFTITVLNANHIIYSEIYSMTLSDVIGQLGGLFDLWMGINLLSIIHVAVFAFKYCIETKRRRNKTEDGKREFAVDNKTRRERVRHKLMKEVEQLKKLLEIAIKDLAKERKF